MPHPLYIESGSGPRFRDVDGNEFIDNCLGWGPLILGHSHPLINEAVVRQLQRGYTYGAQCELEFHLAEKLQGLIPCAERVLFSNTGTEAVQSALRIARAATGRKKIIKFEGHYHGWFDNVLVSYSPDITNAGPEDRPIAVPASKGQVPSAYAETVVLPWNNIPVVEDYLRDFGADVACILTEPILCNNGCILPDAGYLKSLKQLAQQHGVILIFDEVITGFRVAPGGAQALFEVVPDLAIFGKAIGGGFPISVIAGREEIIREVEMGRVVHAGTFNGNPIALSAALATIETLTADGGSALLKAKTYGESIMSLLQSVADDHNVPLVVSGTGTVFRPVMGVRRLPRDYRDFARSDRKASQLLTVELINRGIYCVPDGRWYVSAVHSDNELRQTKEIVVEAFQAFARVYHDAEGALPDY